MPETTTSGLAFQLWRDWRSTSTGRMCKRWWRRRAPAWCRPAPTCKGPRPWTWPARWRRRRWMNTARTRRRRKRRWLPHRRTSRARGSNCRTRGSWPPTTGWSHRNRAVLGNVVNAGAELFRLVRQGRVEWRAELDARQLASARAGQSARLMLPSGMNVEGKVRLVSPTLSATTGRGTVYVSLEPGQGAQPGQFASGTIELDSKPALTLPQSAIVLRDGRSYVYVVDDKQRVASRVVVAGRRQGDRVEVVSGLEPRWRVVASGGAFLSEGAAVTIASADARTAKSGGER